ncbi:MAG TPA: tetratricopeptide repeat protein [Bryobacteraceae bacterium]|jgi:tetratricopeptide (TPR) repeat protein|nr:tetratricopeptide repeat protein [Bryobacteraceae bacterium]
MVLLLLLAMMPASLTSDAGSDLERARDRQDRITLEKLASGRAADAQKKPDDATVQYRSAVAESFLAEVGQELHDKGLATSAAENGIRAAERAVALNANSAEYNRILGTLCGQAISSNGLAALKYGKCALTSVNRALELDPKSADAYLSHGVGYFYLPPAFGGGVDVAIKDFQKALELNPKSAEAYLWLGVAMRKTNRNAEARKALEKALQLNPNRLWAKQQLEKIPPQ